MLDFTNEEDQRELSRGPVPSGSIVLVEITVLEPKNPAQEDQHITVTEKGLRQIPCQFEVVAGTYAGVSFRNNLTLPLGMQKVDLTESQRKACQIGGATLKAICLAARKPPRMQSAMSLNGLRVPVRVKINDRPNEKDGRTYWNNTLAFVITPDKEAYAAVAAGGEIITDGPTTGKSDTPTHSNSGYSNEPPAYFDNNVPPSETTDEVPF